MPRRTASSKDHREPLIKGSSSLDGEEAGGDDGQGGAVGREGGAWEGGGMDYSDEGVGGQQRTEDVSWLRIVCINGVRPLSSTPDSSLFHLPQSYPWLHQESCVPYHSNEECGSSKLLARAASTMDMLAQPGFLMPTQLRTFPHYCCLPAKEIRRMVSSSLALLLLLPPPLFLSF
jgi:hypothetical protein